MTDRFDVAVIGAGPAGSAAAATLARTGRAVLLVDRVTLDGFKVGETLPPAARPLLRDLGMWEGFQRDGHLPAVGNESAWGSDLLWSTDFIRDPNGHGWHLDRARFDAALRTVAESAGAMLLKGRVDSAGRDAAGWRLLVEAEARRLIVRTGWVIDCTGRRSAIARRQGARRIRDDALIAFVAYFQQATEHGGASGGDDADNLTLVESAPDGWWYTARLPGNRRVSAYFTDSTDHTAPQARTSPGYLDLLARTRHVCARVLGRDYTLLGAPSIVGAQSSRLDPCAGAGWIAAGDAAVSFDPLSSQGMLTALFSGLEAARAVSADATSGEALAGYSEAMARIYSAYLAHRDDFYRIERRWPEHRFWRDRRQNRN